MRSFLAAALPLSFTLSAAALEPDVPLIVNHHGRVFDPADNPLPGPVEITVSFFEMSKADDNGNDPRIWTETYPDVPLFHGNYALAIGDPLAGDPLAAADFPPGAPRWLEIKVNGDTMKPRIKVGSVPFALLAGRAVDADHADHADTAGNVSCAGTCISGAEIDEATIAASKLIAGSGSGLDADKLDGHDSAYFATDADLDTTSAAQSTTAADLGAFKTALASTGTPNTATNPVDWSQLKNIPGDIADGDADTLPTLAAVSGGAMAAASGKVGIGTDSPVGRLHVTGGNIFHEAAGANGDVQYTFRRSDGAGDPDMYLTYWGQGDRNTLALTTGGGAGLHVSTGGNVVVGDFTASNFTGSGKFVVPAGNVGIGTTNPQQVLHVSAGAAGEIVSMRNSNGNFGLHFMVNDGTDSLGYGLAGLNAVRVASNEHFAIVTGSTPTPRLVVRETGNVGIGTTTPGYKLDVNGGVNAVWEQSSVITKMALAGPAFELLAHVSPSCSSGTLYAAGGPVNVGGTNVDWSKVQFSTGIGGASLGNQNGAAICGWYSKTCVSDKTVRARITTTGVAYDVNDYTCTKSWGTVWPGWGWYSDSSGTWSPGGYWTTLACCQ